MATKTTTPATTPAGANAFAGSPLDPNAPAPSAASAPGSTTALTTDPTVSTGGMPTFTGGAGTSKTFGGIPTNLQTGGLTAPATPFTPEGIGVAANYVSGDEWNPVHDPNPDNIRNLQTQMIEAGLVQAKKVHFGVWDAYSANAYAKVLAQANAQHTNAADAMNAFIAGSKGTLPAKINGDDLTAMSQSVAQQMIGRNLTAPELTKFNAAFQAAFLAAESSGEGAPTTSAGLQQMGGDILKAENPRAVAANSLHNVSQRALQVLSSPAVSLPSPQ